MIYDGTSVLWITLGHGFFIESSGVTPVVNKAEGRFPDRFEFICREAEISPRGCAEPQEGSSIC